MALGKQNEMSKSCDQSWARDIFVASRQRNNVIETQGQEKIQKLFRIRCLHGVAKHIQ